MMCNDNPHPPTGKERYQYDKCETCGHPFGSQRPNKRWGNFSCYVASPDFKSNNARAHVATSSRANKVKCANCGIEFKRSPSKSNRVQTDDCCSKPCRREFFVKRFDENIATPESLIDTPQNYDEFLSQDELPCLVEGCHWAGKNLSVHMNIVHGVAADDFKARAGFNVGTGVVTTEYSRWLKDNAANHLPKAKPRNPRRGANKGFKFRPEGMEHYRKARAIKEAMP